MKCEKCDYDDPIECTIDGDVIEVLCGKHAAEAGYCCCCGVFSAGITSFDFHHPGYCDNCFDEIGWDEDDEDSEDLDW